MHTENLVIDQSSDWHTVENILKFFPESDRISIFTFIVEAVDSVDAGALVVAAQQKEILRVLDLVGQQQADGLQRLLA